MFVANCKSLHPPAVNLFDIDPYPRSFLTRPQLDAQNSTHACNIADVADAPLHVIGLKLSKLPRWHSKLQDTSLDNPRARVHSQQRVAPPRKFCLIFGSPASKVMRPRLSPTSTRSGGAYRHPKNSDSIFGVPASRGIRPVWTHFHQCQAYPQVYHTRMTAARSAVQEVWGDVSRHAALFLL
ncbi:hypothetical protein C8R43DRAFT_954278 [Mycena crocata]|nr:hypothetical protein C8R43DRAFT_954275 [Mycena crocata]KAJ7143147.1 hypothetical protein C8R43DRAFT_954278 [Mycena crocata]